MYIICVCVYVCVCIHTHKADTDNWLSPVDSITKNKQRPFKYHFIFCHQEKHREYILLYLIPSIKFNFMEIFNWNKTFTKYIHINNSSQVHSLMAFHRCNSCVTSTKIKKQSLNHTPESIYVQNHFHHCFHSQNNYYPDF